MFDVLGNGRSIKLASADAGLQPLGGWATPPPPPKAGPWCKPPDALARLLTGGSAAARHPDAAHGLPTGCHASNSWTVLRSLRGAVSVGVWFSHFSAGDVVAGHAVLTRAGRGGLILRALANWAATLPALPAMLFAALRGCGDRMRVAALQA